MALERYGADATPGAGAVYQLHADRQGSVIAVTDVLGSVVSRYRYDAFGQRELSAGAEIMDVGFTGRTFDAETGFYHYRARGYDPGEGRFIQSDPLGFAAGDLNLYAYTWNDPANWTDPSGLAAKKKGKGGSAEFSVLTAGAIKIALANARSAVFPATRCLARSTGSMLGGLAKLVAQGKQISKMKVSRGPGCRVRVTAPKDKDKREGCPICPPGSSFVAGTKVLTPDGPVAIEDLREGDLVVARNEESGVSGVFPITGLMSRQAPEVIWLTVLSEGVSERIGVTSEHPLFVVDKGWTRAEEVIAGDALWNAGLGEVAVLSVEIERAAQRVYNLEIAGAGTYFVGDAEVWGHNAWPFGKRGCSSGIGPFAMESVPFSLFPEINPNNPRVGTAMQNALNAIGNKWGCHTCGSPNSGYSDGHWTPDHQEPRSKGTPKGIYPHCKK